MISKGFAEYSESDLEGALVSGLERFLLELGNDFAFVARQRRLRAGIEWYRVDLLLFHRRLRAWLPPLRGRSRRSSDASTFSSTTPASPRKETGCLQASVSIR
jgi:hypothetical protein